MIAIPQDSIESLYVEVLEHTAELFTDPDTVPDSGVMAALEALAELCPLEHGPAIYSAREVLSAIDARPRLFLNDCENPSVPQPPSERLAQPEPVEETVSGNDQFNLWPNPSTGALNIFVDHDSEAETSILFADLLGREVYLSRLSLGLNRIVVPMPSGLYLYSVILNGEAKWNGKVVIEMEE